MDHDATILSLFAGIGGFEQAFRKAGFSGKVLAYENWPSAQSVLSKRFPSAKLFEDVQDLPAKLHDAEIVTAGFPCTDLSSAGRLAGISGDASGLIIGVLQAIQLQRPEWVLLENVPNMLRLKGGEAMSIIGSMLSASGYLWCYRTLDAQHFGVAQRRKRVFLLASRHHDPERVLFRDYAAPSESTQSSADRIQKAHGFYWTEGNRGVGWGNGVVPTIKGSTTAGIPSAPGVWLPGKPIELKFRTPSIEALETLQGFRPGWTSAAPSRDRWKLVGNAVAVPAVQWIAEGLRAYDQLSTVELPRDLDVKHGWGSAGISVGDHVRRTKVSEAPVTGPLRRQFTLQRVLEERGSNALSEKATRGFASRLLRSTLRYQDAFMQDLKEYASL
ncbi:DNA cytosine methyltransferase [Arthrobacter sp. NicSoilC12]|uniref:DNA cytosine methyltransferase n=1 Tax=Arthrobacter sp. NicSoilC12 TaxID=2831001 RepID=UPI001CC583C7|nr:DNA (cytosine-5-)-methyltransferase [Arthrobacter sp. NicSoilC12]GIU56684.1 putative BsuMI modification methylase subunit YdiP [Arthrobacter sp. NicSoilC12]